MTLEIDVQQGWHDAIIEMFDIDLEPITGDANDKFYFTNQLKPDDTKIEWKGNLYEPLPILSSGYEKNTTGQIAQPSLTVANIMGTFTQVIDSLDDLVGAKVIRRRTLGKYLDGEAEADPTQEFPIDIFYIERKATENALSITWQLSSILDLEGLQIPRRVITQNYCFWKYRSSECGYTGAPVFNADNSEISAAGQSPEAIAVLNAYGVVKQRRDEAQTALNNRNNAAANKEFQCGVTLLESRFNPPTDYVDIDFQAQGDRYFYFGGIDGEVAFWDGNVVTLDETYRRGPNQGGTSYSIERWGLDAGLCATATATLVTAENDLTIAGNNLVTAENALAAAVASLPSNDLLRQQDICGKQVSNCERHFGTLWNNGTRSFYNQSLPFGGFPGAIKAR